MMNNEIMMNEEIMDAVEEAVVERTFNEGLIYGSVGTAIALIGGKILIDKVGKPMIKKIKAAKEAKNTAVTEEDGIIDGVEFTEKEA